MYDDDFDGIYLDEFDLPNCYDDFDFDDFDIDDFDLDDDES